jgi:GNAT superfamily N-acetyltransferase
LEHGAGMKYRLAQEADLATTYEIMVTAANDLNQKLGRAVAVGEHSPPVRAMAVRHAALAHDAEHFWVAEHDGETVGFGLAIRREGLAYLAALHILPEFQSAGIGRELIRRSLLSSDSKPDLTLTICEAANIASNGLYGRVGLFPVVAIQQLCGPAESRETESGMELRLVRADRTSQIMRSLDRSVFGITRDQDHATWHGVATMSLHLLMDGEAARGYIYVDAAGSLGPAAAESPDLLACAVALGLGNLADAGVKTAHLRVPGTAICVLSMLLDRGFRYEVGVNLLLADRVFGNLENYLFSGADALF